MKHQPDTKTVGLRACFENYFEIGAAIPGVDLTEPERSLLTAHFSSVTPKNCIKPGSIHPSENHCDFEAADALVRLARTNRLVVHGQTLV